MNSVRYLLLLLLCGCTVAQFDLSERLTLDSPEALIVEGTPPAKVSLQWAPQPIEQFNISQNADGLTDRNDYRDFAVGRLISKRVEDYIGTVSQLVPAGDDRVTVTFNDASLNYKFGWRNLAYAKLLVNAEIQINNRSRKKIYYRQSVDRPELTAVAMLDAVFDEVAIEIGQDILGALAR